MHKNYVEIVTADDDDNITYINIIGLHKAVYLRDRECRLFTADERNISAHFKRPHLQRTNDITIEAARSIKYGGSCEATRRLALA